MTYREIFPSSRQRYLPRGRAQRPGIDVPAQPVTHPFACRHFSTDAACSPPEGGHGSFAPHCAALRCLSLRHAPKSRQRPVARQPFRKIPAPERLHPNASRRIIRCITMEKTPAGSGSRRRFLLPRCRARPVRENYGRSALPPDTQAAFSFGRDSAEMADNIGLVAARSAGDAKRRRFEAASENASQRCAFGGRLRQGSGIRQRCPPGLMLWKTESTNNACFARRFPQDRRNQGLPGNARKSLRPLPGVSRPHHRGAPPAFAPLSENARPALTSGLISSLRAPRVCAPSLPLRHSRARQPL